jgi:hypothetical protein
VISDRAITAAVEADLRELPTPSGILRYYDAGKGPGVLFLHGSAPGVTCCIFYERAEGKLGGIFQFDHRHRS